MVPKIRNFFLIIAFISLSLPCFAKKSPINQSYTQDIYLGPQVYYLRREREGGTVQNGSLIGAKIGYDRIRKNSLYWALSYSWAEGRLKGKSGLGSQLLSDFTDTEAEVRLGFAFTNEKRHPSTFIPYVGGGYYYTINKFLPPTAMTIQYRDKVSYISTGFLSIIELSRVLSAGLNITIKWMLDGTCHVSHDPSNPNRSLIMENEWQYSIEAPVTYRFLKNSKSFEAVFVPFYQYRHWGGRQSFPFDFLDTRFIVLGGRILLNYKF